VNNYGKSTIKEAFSPNRVVQDTELFLQQFRQANNGTEEEEIFDRREGSGTARWKRPPEGSLKINWDVACDNRSKCMGAGGGNKGL
jgi:hypothetical protein